MSLVLSSTLAKRRERLRAAMGRRWPKWKARPNLTDDAVTDETRRKKVYHGIKCLRKALKKARTFEERKIQRRQKTVVSDGAAAAARTPQVGGASSTPTRKRHWFQKFNLMKINLLST